MLVFIKSEAINYGILPAVFPGVTVLPCGLPSLHNIPPF